MKFKHITGITLIITGWCFFLHVNATAQKTVINKSNSGQSIALKIAATPVPTAEQYKALAEKIAAGYYALETPAARQQLDTVWHQLNQDENGLASAASVSAAMSLFGCSNAAVVVAARTVLNNPQDTLAANNLGAALHDLDAYREAAQVLLYARKLSPESPLILTNLASLAIDTGDEQTAETLLKEAAWHDPTYCGAWNMLAALYMKQKKFIESTNAILKTGHCGYPRVTQKEKEVIIDRDNPPRPPWVTGGDINTGSTPAGGNSGNTVPSGIPWIPDIPLPATAAAFLQSTQQLKKWTDYMKKTDQEATEVVLSSSSKEAIAQLTQKLTAQAQRKKSNTQYWIADNDNHFQWLLDRTDLNYQAQQKKLWKVYQVKADQIDKHLSDALTRISEDEKAIQSRLAGNPPALQAALAPFCLQRRDVIERGYGQWRKEFAATYSQASKLLEDYYKDSDPIVSKLQDEQRRKVAEAMRVKMIYLTLYPTAYGSIAIRPMLYTFGGVTVGARLDCSPPPPPPPSYTINVAPVPKANGKCPLDPPLKINVEVVSIKIDCSSLELEGGGKGLVGGYKFNYMERQHTFFFGVGGKLDVRKLGLGAEMSAKAGLYVTIDHRKGEVIDLGVKVSQANAAFAGNKDNNIGGEIEHEKAYSFMKKPDIALETGPKLAFFDPR